MRNENDPSAETVDCFIRGYVLASWLYYYGQRDGDEFNVSPWTDHEFDGVCGFIEYWRRLWPADFAARVPADAGTKTAAHALGFTDEEIAAARAWRIAGGYWPPDPAQTAEAAFDDLF